MRNFVLALKGDDMNFALGFLTAWLGGTTQISAASPEEFLRACSAVLRLDKKEVKR